MLDDRVNNCKQESIHFGGSNLIKDCAKYM